MENIPQKKGMHPVWILLLCILGVFIFLVVLGIIVGPQIPDLPEGTSVPVTGDINATPTEEEVIDSKPQGRSIGEIYGMTYVIKRESMPIGDLLSVQAFQGTTDADLQTYCDNKLIGRTYMINFYHTPSISTEDMIGTCTTSNKTFSRF